MMKKLISILLSAILLCSLFSVAAFAAETPSFELSDAQGAVGETVSVKLNIKNNPGITSLQVKVAYSSDDLELIKIDNSGLFDSAISKSSVDKNPAVISWYSTDSENKNDNGTLATLTFEIKEGAKDSAVVLGYDEDDVFNSSFENVSFSTTPAAVKVVEAQPETEETTAPQETTTPHSTTAPQETTSPQTTAPETAYKSLYYLPSADQQTKGYNYKVSIEDKNGAWHEYNLTATNMKKYGVTVYAITIPADFEPQTILYQVYSGETWISQVSKTVSGFDSISGVVVSSSGAETKLSDFSADSAVSKLSKSSASLKAGKTLALKVINGTAKSWSSSKKSVASVSKAGKVTALKKGTASITATLTNGKKLTCKVTIKSNPSIKINKKAFKAKTTYKVKKGKSLTVKISGKAASVKNAYKTSNKKVAKVTSKKTAKTVKIKGLKKGSAKITVKVNGVAFKIKVKVK